MIDPIAPRYTALSKSSAVPVHVVDAKEVHAYAAKHPKVCAFIHSAHHATVAILDRFIVAFSKKFASFLCYCTLLH